ncbi:MAG: kynureninase [Chitinophagaceae bacterium]|nr:kynureninase [Chitinophagaceae bacterium]
MALTAELQQKFTRKYALEMDDADDLAKYRTAFLHPKLHGKKAIYFCGNSLGLQPVKARDYLQEELDDWAEYGVEGHFEAKRPWFKYHHYFTQSAARLVGAKESEVVMCNTLSVNLHLLMLSFYRPTKKRFKIIMEAGAFPSDMYAVETQVKMHGFDPKTAIIELTPAKGKHTLELSDILATIKKHKNTLALVMMGGVNYYTGQYFDMEKITKAAHEVGAFAGFDLAHAVGNKVLHLHDWKVDFACWCSYKYLNSGPGAVAGLYVYEKHAKDKKIFRLGGWWGHDEKTRFQMKKGFKPMPTAESWQLSNAAVFNMAAHRASLDIFDEVGMHALAEKSLHLTGYAEMLLKSLTNLKFQIITPEDSTQRGCQLSLLFKSKGKETFEALKKASIIADWREPNVIRIAPVPLYNSFEDVYTLYDVMKNIS